jgi:hypothetical protein
MLPATRLIALAGLLLALSGSTASAQEPTSLSRQDLTVWAEQFAVPDSRWQVTAIGQTYAGPAEVDILTGRPVVGLGIHAVARFTSNRALVRVLMLDAAGGEHLVLETYSLLATTSAVRLRQACRETCLLHPIIPSRLRIELVDATLDLEAVVTYEVPAVRAAQLPGTPPTTEHIQLVKEAQEAELVARLNQQIQAKGLRWTAGETEISRLTYAEKRRILGCAAQGRGAGPNLQGAEYYVGGVLTIEPSDPTRLPVTEFSDLVESFDWRAQHGANNPGSPYYDNDPDGGGWMTAIKSQRCADCWAHSAAGALEALANLYFNRHVDFDLSEQELVSCSGAGSCSGGNTGAALSYIQREGIVTEACFPESGRNDPCTNCCGNPPEVVALNAYEYVSPGEGEDALKRKLITSGPLAFGISSWWHAIVLTGYDRDPDTGETIWIIKNSWGTGWGVKGYGYVKVPLWDIYLTYRLFPPITTLTSQQITCRDADGDGYYNWGISADGASACAGVPSIKDCDDSNPWLALMTSSGRCIASPTGDVTAPVLTGAATPAVIWPPNGTMVPVIVSGTMTDDLSGIDPDTASYLLADEYGRIESSGPVSVSPAGTYSVLVMVQASRHKYDFDGRRYVVTLRAADFAGNAGSTQVTVTVPYEMKVPKPPPPK